MITGAWPPVGWHHTLLYVGGTMAGIANLYAVPFVLATTTSWLGRTEMGELGL
ncbi:MAG: hypothetical protein ACUVX8_08220 [Candidatus Zipacnadales bacterium]